MSVEVYTDGSCLDNGRDEPAAGIGGYCEEDGQLSFSLPLKHGRQTNNRAEIYAAIEAIKRASNYGYNEVIVISDSKFLIKAMYSWIPKWKNNGWVASDGRPVRNRRDFEELLEAMEDIDVEFEYVPAHSDIEGNVIADKFAVKGAVKNRKYRYGH
ncbi:Ribonuclease H1 [Halotydeus destructor]|nr:Ribonuclease H1 [Halotydeus destructor]